MKLSAILQQAIILVITSAVLLLFGSWVTGKYAFFLLLNGNGGRIADWIFRIWTNLGDGVMWVLAFLFTFRFYKNRWKLTLFSLIISTLLAQGGKHILFPDAMRPAAGQIELSQIHTVTGVELHVSNSFPSGHTAAAFTLYLLACLFLPYRITLITGYLLALGVGYSRIYLAQHFPTDVAAGMIIGVGTILSARYLEYLLEEKKQATQL